MNKYHLKERNKLQKRINHTKTGSSCYVILNVLLLFGCSNLLNKFKKHTEDRTLLHDTNQTSQNKLSSQLQSSPYQQTSDQKPHQVPVHVQSDVKLTTKDPSLPPMLRELIKMPCSTYKNLIIDADSKGLDQAWKSLDSNIKNKIIQKFKVAIKKITKQLPNILQSTFTNFLSSEDSILSFICDLTLIIAVVAPEPVCISINGNEQPLYMFTSNLWIQYKDETNKNTKKIQIQDIEKFRLENKTQMDQLMNQKTFNFSKSKPTLKLINTKFEFESLLRTAVAMPAFLF